MADTCGEFIGRIRRLRCPTALPGHSPRQVVALRAIWLKRRAMRRKSSLIGAFLRNLRCAGRLAVRRRACRAFEALLTTHRKDQAMGFFSSDIKTMDDLFVHTLRDIYYAENKIIKSLPNMIEKATDPQLKRAFENHLGETRNHAKRLEDVFRIHGVEPKSIDCPAIDGIVDEADDVAGEVDNTQVMDAALVAAAQAVEHYEISRYGTLIAWAKQLGRKDCASVLQQTLNEEKSTDQKLSSLAELFVNRKAA
jgi:ferritin-like metal-binding protein YciE